MSDYCWLLVACFLITFIGFSAVVRIARYHYATIAAKYGATADDLERWNQE